MDNITAAQASMLIPNMDLFYDGTLRNGYFLPKRSCGLVTKSYLQGIFDGSIYCPKTVTIKQMNCVSIPKKELIATAIFQALFLDQRNFGFTVETATKVNVGWLLSLLSTYNCNHRYFGKDFVCSPEEKRNQDLIKPKMVANTNDFFTGLPIPDHL